MIKLSSVLLSLFILIITSGCAPKNQSLVKQEIEPATNISEKEKIDFLQEQAIQLSSPRVIIDSLIFKEAATVSIVLDLEGSELSYALNHGIPQTYSKPFKITESKLLEIEAKKPGFKNSDRLSINLIKVNNKTTDAKISVSPEPNESYPGNGPQSLMDLQKGTLNFRAGNHWSGFQSEKTVVDIRFPEPQELTKIYCSVLMDHGAWIFLPQEIQIWKGDQLLGKELVPAPIEAQSAALKFIGVDLPKGSYSELQVHIINLKGIPEWHQGVGTPPWLFIDEIIVE